jgi:type IV pilus biogenesis protein CpaD/CtpE
MITDSGVLVSLHESKDGVAREGRTLARGLDTQQERALNLVVYFLRYDTASRALIRYVDPSSNHESDSWRLAWKAADRLEVRGIDRERVTLLRVPALSHAETPPRLDAIEIVVNRP